MSEKRPPFTDRIFDIGERFNKFTLKAGVAAGVGVVAVAAVVPAAAVAGNFVGLAIGTDLAGREIIGSAKNTLQKK